MAKSKVAKKNRRKQSKVGSLKQKKTKKKFKLPENIKKSLAVELSEEQQFVRDQLIRKMEGLKIHTKFTRAVSGPVITGYYFEVANNVPLAKILNKQEDFALACGVEAVMIQRERGEVVVQVPNRSRVLVDFKDNLYWMMNEKKFNTMKLPIMLGVDAQGQFAAMDLADQPHVMLSGSTNSGKSILQSAIIATLCTARKKSEMRIILVDTKKLDFPLFAGLENVQEIVEDVESWYPMMDELFEEYGKRLELFKDNRVRNIKEFNDQFPEQKVPYIVVVIDELADLIAHGEAFNAQFKKSERMPHIGDQLQRLVQVCRAVGIHVIAATQRASVEVIGGDVKANFPTRIALKLPTATDSRVILGEGGAQNLLGRGDMLVSRIDSAILERYHGPFVHLEDIKFVINNKPMIINMVKANESSEPVTVQ